MISYYLKNKQNGRLILCLFISAIIVLILCWKIFINDKKELQINKPQWLQIHPQVIEQQLGLVGRIQSERQQTLSAPFEGIIREVLVKEGQTVEENQILLRLDPGQIEIRLRQAQAELLKAQREVHQLRHWNSSTDVSRARRYVKTAKAVLNITQANLRDTQILFERGIVARIEVDTLLQQIQNQRQELLSAQEELDIIEARGKGEERKIAEMDLANAQANYQAALEQAKQQEVKAPFSGLILRSVSQENSKVINAQPGSWVPQGAPLLTVIDLDRVQVLTRVDEIDLHQLREGMPVHITGDGFIGQTLTGHIATIAVQSNATDSLGASARYDVVIAIDTPQKKAAQHIRLGMSAKVAISLYRNEQGIVVPPQALQTDKNGETYVMHRVTLDDQPSKINVEPGQTAEQGIEIKGLSSGYVLIPASQGYSA